MFHDDDDGEEQVRRYLDEHGEQLRGQASSVAEELATVGVYVDQVTWYVEPGDRCVNVAFHGFLHDVAFTDRVQLGEQVAFDEAFEGIAEMMVDEEFRRAREELEDDGE